MIRKILQIGDPILDKKTEKISDFNSPDLKGLVIDLIDTLNKEEERSAGLSANQIGENKRVCICRRVDLEEKGIKKHGKDYKLAKKRLWEVMINPEIVSKSKEESVFWEGCLSVGEKVDDTLFGPVSRPQEVEIVYHDKSGNEKHLISTDFFSHVVQHEIDHLDGYLFVGKVKNPDKNLWKAPELDKHIEREGEWPEVI